MYLIEHQRAMSCLCARLLQVISESIFIHMLLRDESHLLAICRGHSMTERTCDSTYEVGDVLHTAERLSTKLKTYLHYYFM